MCGIVGFYAPQRLHDVTEVLRGMNDTIVHRGPDAQGYWSDPTRGVALAHRRLAIVDLTDEGRQPMSSASGRFVIVFNGEIYNFLRIRTDLEKLGHRFRGHSDTEVMLAAFEQWGIEPSLRRFVGMFAFAVWDAAEGELTLVRDRLGKKPLYYSLVGGTLLFGSELKALRAFPGFAASVDRQALALLTRHGYIPGPRTIYQGVAKLEPASLVRFAARLGSVLESGRACFWNAGELQAQASASSLHMSADDAARHLHELLRDAVQLRMIADVPLGAFLSGGIDSSLVVALMQEVSSRPVRTFTIGFREDEYNEAQYARAVARHLGTDHTETYLTPKETLAVIPRLPLLYDEPFADSSQIPTALVCAMYYGQLCFMAGHHEDAEKAFQKALEIDPYMTDARNNLGSVYDATGRKDLAEQQYKKALEDTAYPTPEKVCLNLGQLYASQGRAEEAIAQYRRAVEINPKYYRGHFELASALDRGGKLEEAAREYEVALPDYKGSGEYHYRLGLVYMKLGRPEKAREHFTLCGQLAPGSENASKAYELLKMIP